MFQDPKCICSLGLREYFIATYEERGRSFQAMRDSSEIMRRHFETAAGHFSHYDDQSQREATSQLDANRPLTLRSDNLFDF